MKLNAGLARSLLMAASIGMVVPIYAQNSSRPTPTRIAGGTPLPTRGPTRPATPVPTRRPAAVPETPAAEEKPKEITGLVLPRKGGGYVALELEASKFKLSFYDEKKNDVAANVDRAVLRWNPTNKTGDVQTVLNKTDDGKLLRSVMFVPPPHNFKIFLTLIDAEGQVVEHYAQVSFSQ